MNRGPDGTNGSPPAPECRLLPGEKLLEEREGPGIVGLSQPEDGLLADVRILVGPGDGDQGRHADVVPLLREREYRRLPNLTVHVAALGERVETLGDRLPGGLADPEDRRLPGLRRDLVTSRDLEQVGPDGHRIGE